ncbi:unconventional myosin-Ih [Gracilinanus agilis]|uniref:unconventional myosin-Ih n=1 Tax=Gracilinanus agilis TaxID=191870 RepID=UPI001CFD4677|nr:unconventional myosin-Ih [Gracilinanus agilis]
MEGALTARDKVGVQDFVLLDSYTSESAFLDNLRKRYRENLIYTYIGTLLVSVNPYQELGIYTIKQMELYQGVNFFELPPHVYAIADNAYRMMCSELNNHFILISGESGAGKTEASKKILQYLAVTCPMTESLQIARDRLLLSNPVLEDFTRKTVIGLLDIYGFEVFDKNGFEQFCINYCNEKLQQLLIEMTLKAEQMEYELEGIEWEPIQYFNNKIICDLVEEKHKGIISILDEECLRPGTPTDLSFLEKLEEKVGKHAHFQTRKLASPKARKKISWMEFRLLHYAGEVTYCARGFLEKNNDLLYRHLKKVLCGSKNGIIKECFLVEELENRKRPVTVGTQFKNSVANLIDILMSKEPSYIRCIKPNERKEPSKFDDFLIRHQIKYLGLMEHLRVRRAGFAYRRKYEHFLQRYKSLCPDTWPHWHGSPSEGVKKLVRYIGYKPDEYKLGRTKIFIRFPRTLFATEDAFEFSKHQLVAKIQSTYKGCRERRAYLEKRQAAITLEAYWRGALARKEIQRRKWAIQIIRKFIRGFINRNKTLSSENEDYIIFVRKNYILNLRNHIPQNVLDKSWLKPPAILEDTSEMLKKICTRNLVRQYCREVTPQRKAQGQVRLLPSAKGRRSLLGLSIWKAGTAGATENLHECPTPWELRTLGSNPGSATISLGRWAVAPSSWTSELSLSASLPPPQYGTPVVKYDRNGFKARPRQLILTEKALYVVELAKIKQRIEYEALNGVSTSNLSDGIFVVHVSPGDIKQKGDIILLCEHIFETVTKLSMMVKKEDFVKVVQGSLQFYISLGKEGTIIFNTGQEEQIYKDKNGQLTVVSDDVWGRGSVGPDEVLTWEMPDHHRPGSRRGKQTRSLLPHKSSSDVTHRAATRTRASQRSFAPNARLLFGEGTPRFSSVRGRPVPSS